MVLISTHAPAWGATGQYAVDGKLARRISTHAPRGGRHQAENIFRTNIQFLLTPPRGGRHLLHPLGADAQHISTHAPAWGRLFRDALIRYQILISTHAPA